MFLIYLPLVRITVHEEFVFCDSSGQAADTSGSGTRTQKQNDLFRRKTKPFQIHVQLYLFLLLVSRKEICVKTDCIISLCLKSC